MPPETVLALLTVAILVNLGIMAAVLWFALRSPNRRPVPPRVEGTGGDPPGPRVNLVPRGVPPERRKDSALRRQLHTEDDDVDQVLAGTSAANAYNRTVRIVSWTFIIASLVLVSATDLWSETRPQIVAVLALAGIFVLVVHELLPTTALGVARFVLEGSAAIIFLSLLVMLTGRAVSPFFFVFPLVVGGAALVAAPTVTLILTTEAAVAYTLAAVSDLPTGEDSRRVLAYVAINLTALMLLAYAGMVIGGEQRRTREAAVKLSTVDYLTDLYNRAFFFSSLDREIQRSRRFHRGFCLLMIDLDGLKAINDRFGHFHGDLMLRGVAQVIRTALRTVDVPARYGGDEFVVILPETEIAGAYVVAEKIRLGVTELAVEAAGQQLRASVSIGAVAFPDDGGTADELMIAADEAMYSSKRLGKNRVVGFGDRGERVEIEPAAAATPRPGAVPGFRPLGRSGEGGEQR